MNCFILPCRKRWTQRRNLSGSEAAHIISTKKKRWLHWWNGVKSAAREAKGRRVPQPWCSEERCWDWLTRPSLPLHAFSRACTLTLSLSSHTHKPSLFFHSLCLGFRLLAPPSLPCCTWGSPPHYSVSHMGFPPQEVNLDAPSKYYMAHGQIQKNVHLINRSVEKFHKTPWWKTSVS